MQEKVVKFCSNNTEYSVFRINPRRVFLGLLTNGGKKAKPIESVTHILQ